MQEKLQNLGKINPPSKLPSVIEYVDLESVKGTDLMNHENLESVSAPSRAQRLAQKGDIFYQTVRPYQKNNYYFDMDDNNFVFSTGYAQIRPTKIDGKFLFYKIQDDKFVTEVLKRSTGTSYPAINSHDLSKIDFLVPTNIPEQNWIGKLLIKLDKIITLEQEKTKKLESLKTYLVQNLFAYDKGYPFLRFQNFFSPWETRRLSEITSIIGGGTPSTKINEYWNGDINWFTPSEIRDNIYVEDSNRKISDLGLQKSSANILPKDKTILFTSRAGIGNTAILKEYSATNQGFQSLILDENTNVYFLFSMSETIKKEAIRRASGSTFLEISATELGKITVSLPDIKEQEKIGNLLQSIDNSINVNRDILKNYKQTKDILLRKLFI